jgi:2-oxoisovalerate dehydrogenase E1 component alpha subunit
MAVASVAERAVAYGMPGISVDGTDALTVYSTSVEAVARARRGEGPTLLEARVPRITPHSSQDDDAYRDEKERKAAAAADPLPRLRSEVVDRGVLTEDDVQREVDSIRAEVSADELRALEQPEPEASRARQWLFAGDPPHQGLPT